MLRIGVFTESEEVNGWVEEALHEINHLKNIQWAFLMSGPTKHSNNENLAFKFFQKIDSILLPGKPDLSKKVNANLPAEIPRFKTDSINSFSAESLREIKECNADLILHFSSKIPAEEILRLPKFGVWCLSYGYDLDNALAGFWEWFHQLPVTEVTMIRIKDGQGNYEPVIDGPVKTEYLSFSRNQTALFSKAIDLLVNAVSKLSESEIPTESINKQKAGKLKKSKGPNLWNSILAVGKLVYRASLKFLTKKFFIEQWVLFYSLDLREFPQLNFQKFKALIPPKDRIWADPFVVSSNGKHYVFIEELMRKTNRGHLSCLVLDQTGDIESSQIIIEKPYHLSYPQVFLYQDTWYMIPESGENHTVDLFECTEFPFQWKFKQSILTNVQAYDTTIHFQDGKGWLFCTIKKREGASTDDDLYLFYCNDFLAGDWKPHPKNPVLSDPSNARPAGRIFVHENNLYRPSQIGVPRYGYGLALNKITELNETNYREEVVTKALPDWRKNLISVHTLNFSESMTVIDGQLKRFKF